MADKPMLKECLMVIGTVGLNPMQDDAWAKLRTIIVVTSAIYLVFELFLQFIYNWKGFEATDSWLLFVAFLQVTFKSLCLRIKKHYLVAFLRNTSMFWPWDNLDGKLKGDIDKLVATGGKVAKILLLSSLGCGGVVMLRPLFLTEWTLPYDTYHPQIRGPTPSYYFMYLLQFFNSAIAFPSVIGFDHLFLASLAHVVLELKALRQRLTSLEVNPSIKYEDEKCLKEMYVLIDHHNLILENIWLIDQTYSGIGLFQLATTILLLCSTMIGLISDGFPPNLKDTYYFIPFLSASIPQALIYCWGGTVVKTETEEVAKAMYSSKWWVKTQPKFRRACVMVIQRANRAEMLTAGGMIALNLETFAEIIKLSFSFLSLAQAMNGNQNNSK